jgi:hypothetical protein
MSVPSFSRATGRNNRPSLESTAEPSDEWIAALRKDIENELRPELQKAEDDRREQMARAGSDEAARQAIERAYNDTRATYVTIANMTFTDRLEAEKMRRKGQDPGDSSSVSTRPQQDASQRPRGTKDNYYAAIDSALPFANESGTIDPAGGPDDDPYPSGSAMRDMVGRAGSAAAIRRFGGESEIAPSPTTTLPRYIPTSRKETADTFDVDPEDSEPGSFGANGVVSRRQSSGSMNSLRSRHAYWRDPVQISPKDVHTSRINDFAPSPSTSAQRRDYNSTNRSGIAAALAQAPPPPPPPLVTHPPVRRDSNASIASSRSGGPGSLPRSAPVPSPFIPRTNITPAATAVPIYTPPPQGPLGHSPGKKESSSPDVYAAIPPASNARFAIPPVSAAPEFLDDEPLLQRPSPDVDNTGKSWSARSSMQRHVRHRTSSSDFQARRLGLDVRPGSSASRPSPIAVPSSPESQRLPPSSYSASLRRFDDDPSAGIPIPSPADRSVGAPQSSPDFPRSYSTRSAMRRKTSFTVDQYNRNTSQSPESSRVPYSAGGTIGRRSSVSSHHSAKSVKSYGSHPEAYYYRSSSPMQAYAEQSHDGSASEHSDVGEDEFDEQEFFEELLMREEEMLKREEELRLKEEEAQRKEEEALRKEEELQRKEEEAKRKELEAKRKEEEVKRKEMEAKRKEDEARRKEAEIKRKEDIARRKEEEVKRKEEDARRKEEYARRKEEDARKMEEDARRTEDEARKMEEEVRRMEEEARKKEDEVRRKEMEMIRKEEEAERKEEEARRLEEEARRIEVEARLREEEAERKEEEVRRREEALRLKEEELERMAEEARSLSDEAKHRAEDLRLKEEEALRREEEAKQMEEEARRREDDARRREEDARRKEEDARRKEDDARRREEYARIRAEEAKQRADEVRHRADDARVRAEEARIREELLRKREEEFKLKEDELRKREDELERREAETKRLEEEKRETEYLAEFARTERRRFDELLVEQQRLLQELSEQQEARRQAEELAALLQAEEAREALLLAQQEELSRAEFLAQQEEARKAEKLAEERREAEAILAAEKRRAEALAEERRRAQINVQEERRRAERAAEERWKAEALAQEEKARAELAEEERRRKEFARQLDEQRQDEFRRRAEQQRRQDAFGSNAARSGTPSSSATQAAYTNTTRHSSASSANSDRSSTASNSSWATNSSWTSWASQGSGASSASTQSTAKATPPRRTASSNSHTPTAEPSASRRAAEEDYLKWQERQEEHARRQAEAFRKEQERLERQRQAKAGQMLSKESVLQLFDDHDRQWGRLSTADSVSWTSFPWPMLKKPADPEELTTIAIAAYVLNPYNPSDKSEKDRIKEHIRRWHPDRFETKLLPKVRSEDRELVKDGAGRVVRSLNELLTQSA